MKTEREFVIFETAAGLAALVHAGRRIAGAILPDVGRSARSVRKDVQERFPGAIEVDPDGGDGEPLPDAVAEARDAIRELFEAERMLLSGEGRRGAEPRGAAARARSALETLASLATRTAVDLEDVNPFFREVYLRLARVRPGDTTTYGRLAAEAGKPRAMRAVGMAMARNPLPLVIPCHRVLQSGGGLGGFSASGGIRLKVRLLDLERRVAATATTATQA